jgi:hypothetical protein
VACDQGLHRTGQPRGPQRQCRLGAHRLIRVLQEARHEGHGAFARQGQQPINDLACHLKRLVADARLETQQQRAFLAGRLGQRAHGFGAHQVRRIRQGIHHRPQCFLPRDIRAGRQRQHTRSAEVGRRVRLPAPRRLHLDVPQATQVRRRLPMVESHQRPRDGMLSPALRIALRTVFEQAAESQEQVRNQSAQPAIAGDGGRLGHYQVDPVVKRNSERRRRLALRRVAQGAEAPDLLLHLANSHEAGIPQSRIPCVRPIVPRAWQRPRRWGCGAGWDGGLGWGRRPAPPSEPHIRRESARWGSGTGRRPGLGAPASAAVGATHPAGIGTLG